jgi:phospholipase/lecithinase/hemolysin
VAYDAALEADLAGLAATPGVHLSFLDLFTLLDNVTADPAAYGLSDVTDPCYVGPFTGGGTVCADPNAYLFWDTAHYIAVGNAIIANSAFDAVPEPGTLALLGTGLAGIAMLRRRSAAVRGMAACKRADA